MIGTDTGGDNWPILGGYTFVDVRLGACSIPFKGQALEGWLTESSGVTQHYYYY